MHTKIWKTIELINWSTKYLKSKNITNAKLETEWFLCEILNCKRIDLYLNFDMPIEKKELALFKLYLKRRFKGEPFQHIIGKSPFYKRDFIVNNNVLIPRPETELIIETIKDIEFSTVLEIGTGSGCISITIEMENLSSNIIATDVCYNALSIAKRNALKFQTKHVTFKKHNFLKTKINSKFDLIVSNPPYIPLREIQNLQNEVKNYDPIIALSDNNDGLSFYRRFAQTIPYILNKNGFVILEFGGKGQVNQINNIFKSEQYTVSFKNDLQGEPRVAKIKLN